MLTHAFALGLAASLVLTPATSSAATSADGPPGAPRWPGDPPSGPVTAQLVAAHGTGCPPGTATVTLTPDKSGVEVNLSRYTARAGVGATPADSRKTCRISMIIHAPRGSTYTIGHRRFTGTTTLSAAAQARVRTTFRACPGCSGKGMVEPDDMTFTGPSDNGGWAFVHLSDAYFDGMWDYQALHWAPCDGPWLATLDTELTVDVGTSDPRTTTSSITVSTKDDVSASYFLEWAPCPLPR